MNEGTNLDPNHQIMLNLAKEWLDKPNVAPNLFDHLTTSSLISAIAIANDSSTIKKIMSIQDSSSVEIKFIKTHPQAKLPTKAHKGDNCFDLYCCEETTVPASKIVNGEFIVGQAVIPVGLTVAYISPGFGFTTKNKSGLSFKHNLIRMAGEIDNGYRSDLGVKLVNLSNKDYVFEVGEKCVQFKVERIWDTNLSFTDKIEEAQDQRGEGGFGSSGKK